MEIGRLAKDQEELRRQLDESARAAAESAAKQEELAAALRNVQVIIGQTMESPLILLSCTVSVLEQYGRA